VRVCVRMRVYVGVCMRACVYACMRACVCACMRVCVCVCVCSTHIGTLENHTAAMDVLFSRQFSGMCVCIDDLRFSICSCCCHCLPVPGLYAVRVFATTTTTSSTVRGVCGPMCVRVCAAA